MAEFVKVVLFLLALFLSFTKELNAFAIDKDCEVEEIVVNVVETLLEKVLEDDTVNAKPPGGFRQRFRHRFRDRCRHRYLFTATIPKDKTSYTSIEEIFKFVDADMNTLTIRPTILEDAIITSPEIKIPERKDLPQMLKQKRPFLAEIEPRAKIRKQLETKIYDAIDRLLNFYGNELERVVDGDTAIGLMILKGIDDKHKRIFQKTHPIDVWISSQCDLLNNRSESDGLWCSIVSQKWKNRSGYIPNLSYWKPASYLQNCINQTDDNILEKIGNENDGLWGILNGECQTAIVERCEVPYVCERTLLDPTPRSQYLLTHQLMQRLLTEVMDCPETKRFQYNEDVYANLCAKMYIEAQYLDILDMPPIHRDLFAEYVGFCGYMGYTNFLRDDWLEQILSWQSKSDFGCFVNESLLPYGIISTDFGIKRKLTKKEIEKGILQSDEKCYPHLTSVSLTALSVYWDYLMDLKSTGFQSDEL